MKKISLIFALIFVVCLFNACGTQNPTDITETTESTTVETTEKIVKISVKKETLSDFESFVQSMKDYGADVSDMDGGAGYCFAFTEAEHEKLLKDKYAETVKMFKEYEDNEEHYIDNIEYDEDFRNLIFNVDKDLYESRESSMSDIVVAAVALSYQMYLEDGQKTNVKVVYSETETVVSTFTLPMNLSVEQ